MEKAIARSKEGSEKAVYCSLITRSFTRCPSCDLTTTTAVAPDNDRRIGTGRRIGLEMRTS